MIAIEPATIKVLINSPKLFFAARILKSPN
jgi:hypothetical protein